MKLLGVVFAFVLLFLPLSMNLEATTEVEKNSSEDALEETEAKGFISIFMKRVRDRIEQIESSEIKAEYSETKSLIGSWRERVEEILKRLNNTNN